jgi:hypothetical protein
MEKPYLEAYLQHISDLMSKLDPNSPEYKSQNEKHGKLMNRYQEVKKEFEKAEDSNYYDYGYGGDYGGDSSGGSATGSAEKSQAEKPAQTHPTGSTATLNNPAAFCVKCEDIVGNLIHVRFAGKEYVIQNTTFSKKEQEEIKKGGYFDLSFSEK